MHTLARVLVGLIAVEHVWILVLEMFLWNKPFGRKRFGTTPEFAEASAQLAANQGLYNGFLAAGLGWSFFVADAHWSQTLSTFFLGCVAVAGLYGGITTKRVILVVQLVPAAIALVVVRLAGP